LNYFFYIFWSKGGGANGDIAPLTPKSGGPLAPPAPPVVPPLLTETPNIEDMDAWLHESILDDLVPSTSIAEADLPAPVTIPLPAPVTVPLPAPVTVPLPAPVTIPFSAPVTVSDRTQNVGINPEYSIELPPGGISYTDIVAAKNSQVETSVAQVVRWEVDRVERWDDRGDRGLIDRRAAVWGD